MRFVNMLILMGIVAEGSKEELLLRVKPLATQHTE